MSFLKSLFAKWKVSVGFIGGALVVATAYGTCTVDPNEEAIKDKILKEEPVKEEGKEEAKEEAKEEKKEEAKAVEPKEEEKVAPSGATE